MKKKQGLEARIGTLIKNLPILNNTEYEVMFNLNENTFLQKLVLEEVRSKVRVRPADYFRALAFLTYFTEIIEDDYKVCDNLSKLSKKVREVEKDRGLDIGASYLSINAVVAETGLCAVENGNDYYNKSNIKAIKNRYENKREPIDLSSDSIRKVDLYYETIGRKVCDLVGNKKQKLNGVESRVELEALIFTDCILDILKNQKYKSQINNFLNKKDYFKASLVALVGLSKEISISTLESYVMGVFK